MKNSENLKLNVKFVIDSICDVKKIQDLLFDLEKKVESSLAELSKLKNEKNDLLDKNQILD